MDGLKQWAITLIIGGLAGTFAMIVVPNGGATKTLRTVIGIFVVLIVFVPLTNIDFSDDFMPAFKNYVTETDDEKNISEYMISVCSESVKKEIEKTASELGAKIKSAEIEMYINSEYCIIIQEIAVESDYPEKGELSSLLSEKTGVPVRIIS